MFQFIGEFAYVFDPGCPFFDGHRRVFTVFQTEFPDLDQNGRSRHCFEGFFCPLPDEFIQSAEDSGIGEAFFLLQFEDFPQRAKINFRHVIYTNRHTYR